MATAANKYLLGGKMKLLFSGRMSLCQGEIKMWWWGVGGFTDGDFSWWGG